MTEKNRIIDALGERKLLLPALINTALAANDQVKYLLTLLQMAKVRADFPDSRTTTLQEERVACGLDADELDDVIENTRREAEGRYRIPHLERIVALAMSNVKSMLAPLEQSSPALEAKELVERYQRLLLKRTDARGETISGDAIGEMTSTHRAGDDSIHLLVMDLHQALNRLQAGIAAETIDGARVYEVKPGDRALIKAFMRGVTRTAPLKFDHPGLGTTATHSDGKLVIQNDIGTTDAHVLVVHVTGDCATLTYTDVHLQRLLFFESLFERYDVRWNDTISRRDRSMEDGVYHLSVGRYTARNRAELEEYLSFLGSRLVFLIDWNRARKRLRGFLPKSAALQLLKCAADQDYGHMAFLKLGSDRLVYDALEFVVKGPHRFGERLDVMLGEDAALRYMRFVLKTCSEGLLQAQPDALILDEIKAELLNYFRSAQQGLLDTAAEHATLIFDIASSVRDALLKLRLPRAGDHLESTARRAKEWERQADQLVMDTRAARQGGDSEAFFRRLIEVADDIADDLEEAAFHLTLLPESGLKQEIHEPVLHMADLVVQSTQEYVKALETARYVRRGGLREDTQDFLEAIHRIAAVERRTDEAQRNVKRALLADYAGEKELFVCAETIKSLESSTDGLMHAGLMLRDYMLGEAMAR